MFDCAITITNPAKPLQSNFRIDHFPDGVNPNCKVWDFGWINIKAYYHNGLYHQWLFENDEYLILCLGEIFFRQDSNIECKADKRLDMIGQMLGDGISNVLQKIKGNFIMLLTDKTKFIFNVITSKSCHYDLYFAKTNESSYLSTSIDTIRNIDKSLFKVNEVSLIEMGLFDYPLGKKTIFKNIEWLDQGHMYSFSPTTFSLEQYHSWSNSIKNYSPKYNWEETYEKVTDIFNAVLRTQLDGKKSIISALTSGFDSRTILSYFLKNEYNDVLYYSWGKDNIVDVIFPKIITTTLGLNYQQGDFGEDFMNDYIVSAKNGIRFTNGRATLRRANHFFYYKKFCSYSRYNFTGLYGSEILRPISSIGHLYNEKFLKILLNPSERTIMDVIENYLNNKYLSAGFISTFKQDVFNSISAYVSEVRCDLPDYLALINFTFTSALMKYFGHEIHGTRGYVYTYSPYIDDEFIEFIMMTPVLELDKKAMEMNLKQHLWNTRRGQLFYLPVIRENFPELMKMKTGRFYSPNQLLSPFYPLSVIPALIKKKKYQKKSSLGSEEWILKFIESFKTTNRKETEWSKFISLPGYDKNDFLEYAKYISLKYYLMD
jgi:hypothetical protein